ncbi:MAG TPA: radical SAM protein [bacterium]|nr:radical SAM protein [bacterium]
MGASQKITARADQGALTLTKNLLMLERGKGELLLLNSFDPRPLYIKRGRDYIKKFLDSLKKPRTAAAIKKSFPRDTELLKMLMAHRIVITAAEQKKGLDRTDMAYDKKARDDKNGMSLYLLLSQSCNLGCVYCLNGVKTYKKDRNLKMKPEIAFKSVERCLQSLNPKGKLEIVFFGGEPLMNWPLAKQVITHCEKKLKKKFPDKPIRYHLTSNLTIMPPDLIQWAKRYNMTFLCDIDGPAKIHDQCRPFVNGKPSHDRILKNIRRLREAGLTVALRTTVTSKNQDHMLEVAKHHKKIGARGSAFVPVNPVNSDEDILSEDLIPSTAKLLDGLAKVYKSKTWSTQDLFPFNVYASHLAGGGRSVLGCGAPYGNTPVVDVNGDVYPCIYLVGIKRFYMGNIMDETYPDNGVLDWMMDFLHVDNIKECKACVWRYICGGGCPVGKLTVFENERAGKKTVKYANSIRCDYTKKIIELMLWDLARETAASVTKGNSGKTAGANNMAINC